MMMKMFLNEKYEHKTLIDLIIKKNEIKIDKKQN